MEVSRFRNKALMHSSSFQILSGTAVQKYEFFLLWHLFFYILYEIVYHKGPIFEHLEGQNDMPIRISFVSHTVSIAESFYYEHFLYTFFIRFYIRFLCRSRFHISALHSVKRMKRMKRTKRMSLRSAEARKCLLRRNKRIVFVSSNLSEI